MKKEVMKIASISAAMMFLAGCGQADIKNDVKQNGEAKKNQAEQVLTDAKTANKKTADVGFDWNVTYDLIKKSQELLSEGKYDDSISASKTVIEYSRIGLEQEKASKLASPRYLK